MSRLTTVEMIANANRAMGRCGLSINATARAMPGRYTTNRTWLRRFLGGYINKPREDRLRELATTLGVTFESIAGEKYKGSNAGPRRAIRNDE